MKREREEAVLTKSTLLVGQTNILFIFKIHPAVITKRQSISNDGRRETEMRASFTDRR